MLGGKQCIGPPTYGQSDGVFGKSDLLETELIQIDIFEIELVR